MDDGPQAHQVMSKAEVGAPDEDAGHRHQQHAKGQCPEERLLPPLYLPCSGMA